MGTNIERERRTRNEILSHLRNRFINRSNLKLKKIDLKWLRFVQIRQEETDRSVSSKAEEMSGINPAVMEHRLYSLGGEWVQGVGYSVPTNCVWQVLLMTTLV